VIQADVAFVGHGRDRAQKRSRPKGRSITLLFMLL